MATTRPSYTKLTCPSPTTTTGARGLPRFHNRRRGANVHTRRVRFVRSQLAKPNEKAHLVPFHTPTSSQPEGPTTSLLQPILIDDNGTPATWTLVLFQQVIDRQDRTRAEGRFSFYWNHWRYTLNIQESLPLLPDKDSSHDDDDMPCWLHSIEATTDPAGHHLANRHLAGDRLRIASLRIVPGHPGGLHRSSRLPTTFLMTNHPH